MIRAKLRLLFCTEEHKIGYAFDVAGWTDPEETEQIFTQDSMALGLSAIGACAYCAVTITGEPIVWESTKDYLIEEI